MKSLNFAMSVGTLRKILEDAGVTDRTGLFFHYAWGDARGEWPLLPVSVTIMEPGELLDDAKAVVLHCTPLREPPYYFDLKNKP